MSPLWLGGAASFGFALLLALGVRRLGTFALDIPASVQAFHTAPTPRVGGVGVYLGLLLARVWAADPVTTGMLDTILVAGGVALAAGVAEDVTKKVRVRFRLAATLAAGVLACSLTGDAITRLDVPILDTLLLVPGVAFAFTVFAIAGLANAINIIDGFNGLASGATGIALAGVALVAAASGDAPLMLAALTVLVVLAGFWLVNFPWGKVFLGDGGAYFTGFALAWLAIELPLRNPGVSPWASLLICGYPVIEVMYSIARRWNARVPSTRADFDHLHSLVASRIVQRRLHRLGATWQNAAVSVLIWVCAAVPAAVGVLWCTRTSWLVPSALACLLLYHWLYRRVARI